MMTKNMRRHLDWLELTCRASQRTVEARRHVLRYFNRHLPDGLDEADETELSQLLSTPGWSQSTVHSYDYHLRGYYGFCVRKGFLTGDPMIDMPRPRHGPRVPRPWTDDELAVALRAPAMPWRRAVLLAVYAGLRCAEIVSVRREHIVRGQLRVLGKGKRLRLVPVAQPLLEELDDARPGHLCVGATGRPILASTLSRMQRHVWRRLGLAEDVHLHGGRHWFATSLLEQGADVRVVQQLMGHASLETTAGYLAVTDARTRAAVTRLPRVVEPVRGRLDGPQAA